MGANSSPADKSPEPPLTPRRRRKVMMRLGLYALATVALTYAMVFAFNIIPERATTWDFSHYYASALVLRAGHNPYLTDLAPVGKRLGLQIDEINRGTYTPTFLWLFEPLTRLTPRTAYFVWQSFEIGCLAIALALLLRESGLQPRVRVWVAVAVIFFAPTQLHFFLAQTQTVVLLMMLLVIRALERGEEAQAGLVLALAGLLRAYPLGLLGYFAARHHWKALAWCLAGVVAGAIVTMRALGPQICWSFRGVDGFVTSRFFLDQPANLALGSFVSRIFWRLSDAGVIAPHEALREFTSIGARAVLAGSTFLLTWRPKGTPDKDRRAYSIWIATTVLVAPTAWDHYMVLLALPAIQIVSAASRDRTLRPAVVMLAVSYVLADLSFAVFAFNGFRKAHSIIATELGFVSAAAAWVAIALFAAGEPGIRASAVGLWPWRHHAKLPGTAGVLAAGSPAQPTIPIL